MHNHSSAVDSNESFCQNFLNSPFAALHLPPSEVGAIVRERDSKIHSGSQSIHRGLLPGFTAGVPSRQCGHSSGLYVGASRIASA